MPGCEAGTARGSLLIALDWNPVAVTDEPTVSVWCLPSPISFMVGLFHSFRSVRSIFSWSWIDTFVYFHLLFYYSVVMPK